jgi:hypothetical protein
LGVRLAGVGLGATGDLVGAASEGLFGLVERGLGGVGGLWPCVSRMLCIASGLFMMGGETYHLLARLGVEIFAESLRHCGG